jgi:hypothetical protein
MRFTWAGRVVRMVGKPEGKSPLGRQRRRWVDNIKTDLVELVWLRIGTSGELL